MRGPQPGAEARPAHGPETEIDRGAAGRGPATAGGGRDACRTRAQLRRRKEHDFAAGGLTTTKALICGMMGVVNVSSTIVGKTGNMHSRNKTFSRPALREITREEFK